MDETNVHVPQLCIIHVYTHVDCAGQNHIKVLIKRVTNYRRTAKSPQNKSSKKGETCTRQSNRSQTHFMRSIFGFLMYAVGLRLMLAPARRPELRKRFPGRMFSCAACMLATTPSTTASRLSFTNPNDITWKYALSKAWMKYTVEPLQSGFLLILSIHVYSGTSLIRTPLGQAESVPINKVS